MTESAAAQPWLARGGAALGLALLLLAGAALPAAAQDASCHDECKDARRTCRRAAHTAHMVCRDQCAAVTAAAVDRAREYCAEQGLEGRDCAPVIAQALRAAIVACRDDCSGFGKRARAVCNEERRECVATCSEDIDPACSEPCVEEFKGCREDLRACISSCPDARRAAFAECREMSDRESNPAGLRECLKQARHATRECRNDCHAELPCGGDLGMCLSECREPIDG